MQKLFKLLLFAVVVVFFSQSAFAQESTGSDTTITSIEADLINLFNQKNTEEIQGIQYQSYRQSIF